MTTSAASASNATRPNKTLNPRHELESSRRGGFLVAALEQAGIIEPAVRLLEHALSEDPAGLDVAESHHQLATCREKQLAHSAMSAANETQSGCVIIPRAGRVMDKDTRLYGQIVALARDG